MTDPLLYPVTVEAQDLRTVAEAMLGRGYSPSFVNPIARDLLAQAEAVLPDPDPPAAQVALARLARWNWPHNDDEHRVKEAHLRGMPLEVIDQLAAALHAVPEGDYPDDRMDGEPTGMEAVYDAVRPRPLGGHG